MTSVEESLSAAGKHLQETRRPFDVGAGLRRLARDAHHLAAHPAPRQPGLHQAVPDSGVPAGPKAGHQLSVVARWVLTDPRASGHVERLAGEIGANSPDHGPLKDMDVDGALVFACMLYLAGHPESAGFWWQLAAGAGHRIAAYCLHLNSLELGELKEAEHWLTQVRQHDDLDDLDDDFLLGVSKFASYVRRNPTTPKFGPGLTQEVDRLATRGDTERVLVTLDHDLADRLHDFAEQR
ncbi:hypothetical protein [Streptomyces sp. NPDC087294]|uniref:hypothetical protein n=1 Tax=Streptomyces sp. NPDC087294 TaxID=3365777 RepID=UPI003802D76B